MEYLEALAHERFDEALALVEAELQLDPTNVCAWTCCAAAHFKLGLLDLCESDCKSALKLEPLNSEAKYWLGLALFYRSNFVEAKRIFSSLNHPNAKPWLAKCEA